jgi:hypothetical protein
MPMMDFSLNWEKILDVAQIVKKTKISRIIDFVYLVCF